MSDFIGHECGVGLIRLLQPIAYYIEKYRDPLYGFKKLFLLMEKQHNRGQDGAGIGCGKLGMPSGQPFLFRERSAGPNPLMAIFEKQTAAFDHKVKAGLFDREDAEAVKTHFDFGGEVLMGHLRYGTSGNYQESSCHPYFRRSNWSTRNVMLAGNFNMTNMGDLHQRMIDRGQHPIFDTDTQTVLEEIGFHLDEEHTQISRQKRDAAWAGSAIPEGISRELDLARVLRVAAEPWDGGYVIAGLVGNGDAFVLRDPHGIRPCYFLKNEEIIAFASERPPLMMLFDEYHGDLQELKPGCAIIIKNTGAIDEEVITQPRQRCSCSFERIYFSRGNDPDIYTERQALGQALVSPILQAIDADLAHTVFSYIPNTAEIAYYGLMEGLRRLRREAVKGEILRAQHAGNLDEALLDRLILHNWPREEKVAHKDIKLRTFISQEKDRNKLVRHVYDITYGPVQPNDTLVVLDDSIVRGTTLKQSILKILVRTQPRSIIIASTAPQIRYPDCYGIDMSELGQFIAFQATISLLHKTGQAALIDKVYQQCCAQAKKPPEDMQNYVRQLYTPFSAQIIAEEIVQLVYPHNGSEKAWQGEITIIFQSIESLHQAVPDHTGDWYFTGNYPTPGGYAVLNQAFIHFYEQKDGRSY